MNKLEDVDVESAEAIFAIANTPLFLLKNLKRDIAVEAISEQFHPKQIYDGMAALLKIQPTSLEALVRPYVYLVALYQMEDAKFVDKASNLPASHHKWFNYISQTLNNELQPTSTSHIRFPASVSLKSSEKRQQSQTSTHKINLRTG